MRENSGRVFPRHTVDVPLEIEQTDKGGPVPQQTVNVSYGGLAFLSGDCPRPGEILRLRIPTVVPVFEAEARVAWCRPESERFLVGVQFLDAGDAFRSRMVQQVCAIENYRREAEKHGRFLTPPQAAAEWISKYAATFPDSEVA